METKQKSKKLIPIILLIFSIIGILTSIYLTSIHLKESSSPTVCDINDKFSCTLVAQSSYSMIGPIPVSIIGIAGYSLLLILAILHLTIKDQSLRQKLKYLQLSVISIAMLFTVYLIIIEVVVKLFCPGCLVSQASTTIMFIASYIYYFKQQ